MDNCNVIRNKEYKTQLSKHSNSYQGYMDSNRYDRISLQFFLTITIIVSFIGQSLQHLKILQGLLRNFNEED